MSIFLDRPLIETLFKERKETRTVENCLAENPRLALYLPFSTLKAGNESFRELYLEAYVKLLNRYDVRENFYLGDIFEPEARKNGFDYVVKATHLTPWLIEYGYLTLETVEDIAKYFDDPLLYQGFAEAIKTRFFKLYYKRYEKPEPLFNSERRKKWLESLGEKCKPGNLTGNYLENLRGIKLPEPKAGEILIIGGSRLKGYGRKNSDLDFYVIDQNGEIQDEKINFGSVFSGNPNITHLIFDTAWYGEEELVKTVRGQALEKLMRLVGKERERALERLENDLLQYRLMHRFSSIYDDVSSETKNLSDIDGASAFYDERYRELATELYLDYVFIPFLKSNH